MRRSMSVILVWVLGGALTGCAGQVPGEPAHHTSQEASAARVGPSRPVVPTEPAMTPEEALRARATKLWEARVKDDVETQYALLERKAREQLTLTGFARTHKSVTYRSYQLQEVVVDGDLGHVKATVTFRLRLPQVSGYGPFTREIPTFWVREEGGWYLKFSQLEDAERLKRSKQTQP